MSLIFTFSILLFATFSISILLGVYVLSLNMKDSMNKLFFLICISLAIWSYTFSVINVTQNQEDVLLLRRASSLGWGTIFSFSLHFLLVLTERTEILKRKLSYILIYVPSAIHVFAFGIYGELANKQYLLVYSNVGWINTMSFGIWDWFYKIYYVTFTIAAIVLVIQWTKNSQDSKKNKQANLMINSFVIAVALGTLTDTIINGYTSYYVPQIIPIIAMLPIVTIYYAIRRYGLMVPEKVQITKPGMILNLGKQEKIYHNISMVFLYGSLLNYVSQFYIAKHPLGSVLSYSMCLFFIGFLLQMFNKSSIVEHKKDLLFATIISLSVPIILLKFIQVGSVTIWAAPIIFVVVSVVFNKLLMFYGLSFSILSTLIYIWVIKPVAVVEINSADHIVRLTIFVVVIWMAYYVNRIYVSRLEENEDQIRFQKAISNISTDLITISEANMGTKLNYFLKICGEYLGADQAFIIRETDRSELFEWYKDEKCMNKNPLLDVKDEDFQWTHSRTLANDIIWISDIENIPQEFEKEKAFFRSNNIRSLILIKMSRKNRKLGFVSFASKDTEKIFKENHQELLQIVINIVVDGLIRIEDEKEINFMAHYDALTGVWNRQMFKTNLEESIHYAKEKNELIGVIFIDLDSFKSVNDTMGHISGDKMLITVAKRLSSCLGEFDIVSRFGGDEFLVQVNQAHDVEEIKKVAEKIVEALAQPIYLDKKDFLATASIGVAIYPEDGQTVDTLIKNADMAMYVSKENGKHQYTMFSDNQKR